MPHWHLRLGHSLAQRPCDPSRGEPQRNPAALSLPSHPPASVPCAISAWRSAAVCSTHSPPGKTLRSIRRLPSALRTARHRHSGVPRTLGGVKVNGSEGISYRAGANGVPRSRRMALSTASRAAGAGSPRCSSSLGTDAGSVRASAASCRAPESESSSNDTSARSMAGEFRRPMLAIVDATTTRVALDGLARYGASSSFRPGALPAHSIRTIWPLNSA